MENYIPLFQTMVWPLVILFVIVLFRTPLMGFLDAVTRRSLTSQVDIALNKDGFNVKLGELVSLPHTEQMDVPSPVSKEPPQSILLENQRDDENISSPTARNEQRKALYEQNRNLFLAHILTPSDETSQKYNIYIYLVRHWPDTNLPKDLSDVKKAEFFFGRYWNNRVFEGEKAELSNGLGTGNSHTYGIATAAYGEFLCTCLITFTDESQVMLHRYIDFEMGKLYLLRSDGKTLK